MIAPQIAKIMTNRLLRRLDTLSDWVRLIGLALGPRRGGADRLYSLVSTNNALSADGRFLNLGYWANAKNYDEACRDLVMLLAQAAQLQEDDIVLDAGPGFAEQDILWIREEAARWIVGLNITRVQNEIAARRLQRAGLSHRIAIVHGSATRMPLADNSVSKVVALESAFHFNTRERFFSEAFRVLKSGGLVATADLLYPPADAGQGLRQRVLNHLGRRIWHLPAANSDSADGYAEKLRRVGFAEVRVRSIRDHVLVPFRLHLRSWLGDPDLARRMNPVMKLLWRAASSEMKPEGSFDYVIATALRR
jgi:ubiquinone/menaquinone biosynthesis C-methylase UbiE